MFPCSHSRVQDLEAHSKACSISTTETPKPSMKTVQSSPQLARDTSRKQVTQPLTNGISGEHLVVNVTRASPGTTDLAPFKVVTKVRACVLANELSPGHPSILDVLCSDFPLASLAYNGHLWCLQQKLSF